MIDRHFLEESRALLADTYLPKIRLAVEALPDGDLWWRPNEASNSVGNLLLHLAGNLRQWVVSGVGGDPDVRRRQEEFDARGEEEAADADALLRRLEEAVSDAVAVIGGLNGPRLAEPVTIQGRETTALRAVYHAVEHFSMHAGQILWIAKARSGEDLGLYQKGADGHPKPAWTTGGLPLVVALAAGLAAGLVAAAPAPAAAQDPPEPVVESTLEVLDIETGQRRVVYRVREHLEAPNWSPDGRTLLYNSGGRIWTIPADGGEPRLLDTGFATRVNNDHGISPDGTRLVISDQSQGDGGSRIYVLPIEGGEPRLVTPLAPSYWHGWSPDGRTLAYVGQRDGEFDIYTIPADGGDETRLTTAPGLDDGPDYSPDGRHIWFNSVRTGAMQIWRMAADGRNQDQMTFDPWNDWFPHPSPDGRWVVFLSYGPEVDGHPANRHVRLRLMPAGGGEPRTLAELFGGQGTINVPSWAPDSRRFAFVSYRVLAP